jgi:hypothetical protein
MKRSKISYAAGLAALGMALSSTTLVAGTKMENGTEVRDWQAIDGNKDHLISPEEMEKFLQATWAKNKPK